MNTNKYEATLSNFSAIFDSGEFDTFDQALEWSLNRGKRYKVNITRKNISWDFVVVNNSIQIRDPFTGVDSFIAQENVKKECGIVLDPEYL
jgi:hypothetical protein